MTRKELPARAANIQRAVASPAACTSATVESLRSFLLPTAPLGTHHKQISQNVPSRGVREKLLPASTKKASSRARKHLAVDVLEVPQEDSIQVDSKEKATLATEVVNATLRALTDAMRNTPATRISKTKREPLTQNASSSSFSPRLECRSQNPLQPLCVNQVANVSSKGKQSRRSSSDSSVKHLAAGLRAQIDCARIAFATLRSIQWQKSPQIPSTYLQLETGMSALIARMIALGFDDLAEKELRILRRRLETLNSSSMEPKATKILTLEDKRLDLRTEALADMLEFRNLNDKGPLLGLIVTSQLQILRILTMRGQGSATEAALKHLEICLPYSPATLIQRQIASDIPKSREQATRQLEVLAQSMIALCPGLSALEDETGPKSRNSLHPQAAFQIQVLALQIRLTWWKISDHQANISKEMIDPFSQCLAAFHRRSKLSREKTYNIEREAFKTMVNSTREVAGFREEALCVVYQMLASSAQESVQFDEAIRWLRIAKKLTVAGGASQIQKCSLNCKLATLQIRALSPTSGKECLDSMVDASQTLGGDLGGSSSELDELLVSVSDLRRSTFSAFQDSQKPHGDAKVLLSPALSDECLSIVLLCLRFVTKYVGHCPRSNENDKILLRYNQRRGLAGQVTQSIMESVVAMAKHLAKADDPVWQRLELGLQDCVALAHDLEGRDNTDERLPKEDKSSSIFVSTSNAYWYRYIHLKQKSTEPRILKRYLQASIDLIKHRSSSAKVSGFLSAKLEKLGQLNESFRDYGRAAEAYGETLRTQIDMGNVQMAADLATTRSIPDVLGNESELSLLSRVLLAYPRAAMKAQHSKHCSRCFFDVDWLSASERGVILEQQYTSLVSIFHEQVLSSVVRQALQELALLLKSLYAKREFPVRRLHLSVRLLSLHAIDKTILDEGLINELLHEGFIDSDSHGNHSDVGLLQFLPHLIASRDVSTNFRRDTSNLESIEKAVSAWSELLQRHSDWTSLLTQVYDILGWSNQLDLIAEYLEMQGLELARLSVLSVIVSVQETLPTTDFSTLVSKLSALGLQYVRSGYSGLAGATLRKAQKYVEASDIAPKNVVRFHICCAELAVLNRDLKSS